jgi:hypothetical protein
LREIVEAQRTHRRRFLRTAIEVVKIRNRDLVSPQGMQKEKPRTRNYRDLYD